MRAATEPFLAHLQRAAKQSERDEREYRDNYFKRLAELERARVLAHRRLDLLNKVSAAIENVADDGKVHDQVARILRNETGLASANEGHKIVIDRFHAVTDAIGAAMDAESASGDGAVMREIEAFEAWYKERAGREFFSLCDVYAQETPRVDF